MDTTENNDKLQKLQMLKQEKQALEKKLNKVDIWVFPITIIVIGLGLLVNVFDIMSVDIATWIIGVLLFINHIPSIHGVFYCENVQVEMGH